MTEVRSQNGSKRQEKEIQIIPSGYGATLRIKKK